MATSKFDPADRDATRESTRRTLALAIIAIFGVSIVAAFLILAFMNDGDIGERADVAVRLGAPVAAIVGTVLGFYFGSESTQ